MPSITYWNRLEPRPRATDLADALAARLHDPAWLLTRQWQLGEFEGEDAGSPAYVRIAAQLGHVRGWGQPGAPAHRVAGDTPLERYAVSEAMSPDDLALAVELGQTFDRFLADLGALDVRGHFLAAYPITDAVDADPRAARLRALWRGRAIDGVALWKASQTWQPPVPLDAAPPGDLPPRGVPWAVPNERRQLARQAVRRLVRWVATTMDPPCDGDPEGWAPADLGYQLRVYATDPAGGRAALDATPDARGDLEWYAFDRAQSGASAGSLGARQSAIERAVIPGPVRFRGMPNERFWDFEDGRFDIGALRPDRRSLASMILMDFLLVHGNDWYLVPFEQPVGTLCRSALTVVDVFGQSTKVPRADAEAAHAGAVGRFTMFSTARADGGLADSFLVPSTAAASVLDGSVLEQVRFLRDETANLAWAVEHTVEGPLGRGERRADQAAPPAAAEVAAVGTATLRYQLQSSVPPHWFPFQPVKLGASPQVALERASLLSATAALSVVTPRGKILSPRAVAAGTPYRVREEQIPREGTRVTRLARRSRGVNGTTHVWLGRARSVGTGEGWSGLRFDEALPITPIDRGPDE